MLSLIIALLIISVVALLLGKIDVLNPLSSINRPEIITLGISGLFLVITMSIAWRLSFITSARSLPLPTSQKIKDFVNQSGNVSAIGGRLSANDILMREFEYLRETAGQAMEERRTVINFYLLIAGGAGSGVIAFLSNISNQSRLLLAAVMLLWIVCLIGWISLFMLIALRLAWINSALAMNYIKEFYVVNAENIGMSPDILQSAFLFQPMTLPSANKHWNVFHYSALLIALLDAGAFLAGAMLIEINMNGTSLSIVAIIGGVYAMGLFIAHWWSYDISLLPRHVD